MSAYGGIVLQNFPTARVGSLWGMSEHGALLALPPSPRDRRQIYDIRGRELGLRSASCWRRRRWSFDILGEFSQVLGGGNEQNLVAGAAQAPQPQPIELQDALHVCKQHLDFLALSARLLEGLGVGQRADAIAHLLVDVPRDLAHGPGRALGLQRAGRAITFQSPIIEDTALVDI